MSAFNHIKCLLDALDDPHILVRREVLLEACQGHDLLRAINAELLAALNKIVTHWYDLHPKDRAQARAAIAKTKGETI